jgi:hypothetical protein
LIEITRKANRRPRRLAQSRRQVISTPLVGMLCRLG